MTINEHVSDERIAHIRASYEASRKGYAFIGHPSYDESIAIIDELQQYRAAAEKPIFFVDIEGDDWIAAGRMGDWPDGVVDANAGRWPGCMFDFNDLPEGRVPLYAAPQLTSAERQELEQSAKPACYALTNSAGEVYNTHSSPENADAYRWLIHQSDDSLTLRVTPLYAAPQVTSETEKLVEQARAVIHCLDMCGVPAGCYADNPQLSLWGRVIEYANTPVTQVTSVPDGVARAIEKLRQDLVNCNRYNYCFEAVNQVENACRADMLAAPAVQAEQEPVSQPYTLPKHSPCADAPDHIWLQTAGEWPASGEFSELTWSCDNQHPDDTLYVRADLVGNSPCYLQGYKDGCEWSALMAEAIRKGPDMLKVKPDFREITNSSTNNCRENADSSTKCWIPVSERMPETMTSVLVTGTWFHHAVSFWDGASWCDLDYEPPVTHWMPLPAAPKQEALEVKK